MCDRVPVGSCSGKASLSASSIVTGLVSSLVLFRFFRWLSMWPWIVAIDFGGCRVRDSVVSPGISGR